jgi:NAD+-processing family protein with receiver domain
MIPPRHALRPTASALADDEIRLWLDDDLVDRAAPPGWMHVTTVKEATDLLHTGRVVELSLDHDLGDGERFGRGIEVVDWLAEQQEVHERVLWPRDGTVIHSANPAGRDAMVRAIENYASRTVKVRRSLTPSGKPRLTFSQS